MHNLPRTAAATVLNAGKERKNKSRLTSSSSNSPLFTKTSTKKRNTTSATYAQSIIDYAGTAVATAQTVPGIILVFTVRSTGSSSGSSILLPLASHLPPPPAAPPAPPPLLLRLFSVRHELTRLLVYSGTALLIITLPLPPPPPDKPDTRNNHIKNRNPIIGI